MSKLSFSKCVALVLVAVPGAAVAQNSAPVQPIKGLDDFSLPSTAPAPRPAPAPEPTIAAPRAAVTPAPSVPVVRSTVTPTPRPIVVPTVRPAPSVTPSPAAALPPPVAAPVALPSRLASPLPIPTPSLEPIPDAPPEPSASPEPEFVKPIELPWWTWLAVPALLVLGGVAAAGWWWRRRGGPDPELRDDRRHETFRFDADDVAPVAEPEPVVAPVLEPIASLAVPGVAALADRAQLELEFIPKRAGTNLLSAAVEYMIRIRNAGPALARDLRLDLRLLSAGRTQDALIAELFAMPIAAPITAPFDLAPGATVELGGMAMHPKETLEKLAVDGRILFVPVVAVNLRYAWDGGSGQAAHSYVVGLDRGGGGKLQPFRLDGAARMFDTVGALEYTVTAVG